MKKATNSVVPDMIYIAHIDCIYTVADEHHVLYGLTSPTEV